MENSEKTDSWFQRNSNSFFAFTSKVGLNLEQDARTKQGPFFTVAQFNYKSRPGVYILHAGLSLKFGFAISSLPACVNSKFQ